MAISGTGRTICVVTAALLAILLSGCIEVNFNNPDDHPAPGGAPENQASAGYAEPAPTLGMVSDSALSSTSKWTVKISSASKEEELPAFLFVLSTPSSGTLVARSDSASFASGPAECWQGDDRSRKESGTCPGGPGFRIRWTDVDGNHKLSAGDTIAYTYEGDPGGATYADTFPAGAYTLEVLHSPSGTSAGELPRTF